MGNDDRIVINLCIGLSGDDSKKGGNSAVILLALHKAFNRTARNRAVIDCHGNCNEAFARQQTPEEGRITHRHS